MDPHKPQEPRLRNKTQILKKKKKKNVFKDLSDLTINVLLKISGNQDVPVFETKNLNFFFYHRDKRFPDKDQSIERF